MGSGSKNINNGVGGSGEGSTCRIQTMPATTTKVIQNLKEIVNVPEQEIYDVLKECGMEPNVAVERLLSQDTFHVVKSKRERRKEMKDTNDFRSHGKSTGHNRSGRAVTLRKRGPSHMSYSDLHKVSNKGENGSVCPSISSSTAPVRGRRSDSKVSSNDDSFNINGTHHSVVKNGTLSTAVPSSMCHVSAWSKEGKVHLSMAEIVRMEKPPKDSLIFPETLHLSEGSVCSYQDRSTQVSSSQQKDNQALDFQKNSGHSLLVDDGTGIEQPMASNLPLSDVSSASGEMSNHHCNFTGCRSNSFLNHDVDAILLSKEYLSGRDIRSDNKSASSSFTTSADGASTQTESKDCGTYDSRICSQQCQEAGSNVQRLSIMQTEDKVEVVLPNHLQALVADCPHLSFGTYNAGNGSASPSTVFSTDWKESKAASSGFHYSSSSAYNGSSHDNYRVSMSHDNYGYPTSPLQEQMEQVFPNATPGRGHIESLSDYDPSVSLDDLPTSHYRSANMKSRDLAAFSGEKTVGSGSITREFLGSSLKSPRSLQSSYSLLQSTPSKYCNTASSLSSSSFSMPEVTKPSVFSLPQQSPLRPQHLGMQPVGRLATPISYPSSPRSNIYNMPPNLRNLYSDDSGYNLSLSDMKYGHQHNRNEVSMSRISLFDGDTSAYRNLRSLAHDSGSFVHDSPTASMNSSGYHNILPSQVRGGHSFNPLKQNGGLALRSLSFAPTGTYHQHAGRTQQPVEYQLAQLASSYGVSRYSDLYPSHTGMQDGSQDYLTHSLHAWQH